ncbi:MAG: DMT family transporter [Treponemataceae bacterium]|nr:DMT family transporter [Treponemataceae bacterium]
MKKLDGVPALILCALLWSTGGILIKLVDWNPFAISATRSLIAGVFISIVMKRLPFFVIRRKDGSVDRKATSNLWFAAICYALTMIFYVLGNKMTTAANTILLEYTSPIYIIIFGPAILGEKNKSSDYISVLVVMCGMILFFSEGLESGNMAGNVIAALSGVAFGFCTIFMRNQPADHSINSFVLAHLITFVFCIPFAFITGLPDGKSCLGLLLMGIFQTGLPSVLYSLGLKKVRALTATFVSMIEPLMNPVWVMLFAGEVPSWQCVAGGSLILACICVRAVLSRHRTA